MSVNPFEAFVLYYTAWQDGEISLSDMKEFILAEVGEEGMAEALNVFRQKRLEREAQGVKMTLYEYTKLGNV